MSYTAKSVILDIADNYTDVDYTCIRSIDFWFEGSKIDNITTTDFVAYSSAFHSSYPPALSFDTSKSKIGSATGTQWYGSGSTKLRLVCVFNNAITFDEIRVNNAHSDGAETTRGVKNVKITVSTDEITSIVYDEEITNSFLIYDSTFDEHVPLNAEDEQNLVLILYKRIIVDYNNIDSDLTHFPIPVIIGDSVGQDNQDLSKIFDSIGEDYNKLYFTDLLGNALYAEVETWDAVNKKAVIWVSKHDLVLSSTDITNILLSCDPSLDDNFRIGTVQEEKTIDGLVFTGDDFVADDGSNVSAELWYPENTLIADKVKINSNKVRGTFGDPLVDDIGYYYSRYKIIDGVDFDTQIDFDLITWPGPTTSANYAGLALSDFSIDDHSWSVYRRSYPGGLTEEYVIYDGNTWSTAILATGTSGKLRIVRVGTVLKAYIWSGTQWEWDGNTAGYTFLNAELRDLHLSLYWKAETAFDLIVDFSNFIMSSNSFKFIPSLCVWDKDYQNIYHMSQIPATTADSILDSTVNGNHGKAYGTMDSTDLVDGLIGKAIDFDGVDDYLDFEQTQIAKRTELTLESFMNMPELPTNKSVAIGKYSTASARQFYISVESVVDGSVIHFVAQEDPATYDVNGMINGVQALVAGNDTYIVGVFIGGTSLSIYKDGELDNTSTTLIPASYENGTSPMLLGNTESANNWFKGEQGEVRISSVARSEAYLKANNFAFTDNLLTFTDVLVPIVQVPWLGTWKYRRKITIDNTNINSDLTHHAIPIILGATSGQSNEDVTDIFDELTPAFTQPAQITGDDFATINDSFWTYTDFEPGVFYHDETEGRIVFTRSGTETTSKSSTFTSKFKLKAGVDFDIQIAFGDVSINGSSSIQSTCPFLKVANETFNALIKRYYGTYNGYYRSISSGLSSGLSAYDADGILRITRVGAIVSVSNWSGYVWENIATGLDESEADLTVSFGFSHSGTYDLTGWVDNFAIVAGETIYDDGRNDYQKKIAITKDDGVTQLYGEIDTWDTVNKKGVIWASKSDLVLLSTSITELYLYYGSDQPDNDLYIGTPTETPALNVWDSDFLAVWNMGQNPGADLTGCVLDSTGVYPITPMGDMTGSDLIDGKTGKAISLDGLDDELRPSPSIPMDSWISSSVIFKVDNITQVSAIFGHLGGERWTNYGKGLQYTANSGDLTAMGEYGNDKTAIVCDDACGVIDQWYNVGVDFSADAYVYVDNIIKGTGDISSGTAYTFSIGRATRDTTGKWFAGSISQLSLSKIQRSPDWYTVNFYGTEDNLLSFASVEIYGGSGGDETSLTDMFLDISMYADFVQNAKMDLSAYYQAQETSNLDMSIVGNVQEDTPMALQIASWDIMNMPLDLSAFYQSVHMSKLDLMAASVVLQDSRLNLNTAYQFLADFILDFQLSQERLRNAKIDFQLTDGILRIDGKLDLALNAGILYSDMGLCLSVLKKTPTYKAKYVTHLSSAITVVT